MAFGRSQSRKRARPSRLLPRLRKSLTFIEAPSPLLSARATALLPQSDEPCRAHHDTVSPTAQDDGMHGPHYDMREPTLAAPPEPSPGLNSAPTIHLILQTELFPTPRKDFLVRVHSRCSSNLILSSPPAQYEKGHPSKQQVPAGNHWREHQVPNAHQPDEDARSANRRIAQGPEGQQYCKPEQIESQHKARHPRRHPQLHNDRVRSYLFGVRPHPGAHDGASHVHSERISN